MNRPEKIIEMMGFKIIATECCSERVVARTHKKRRIRKKWLKRYGYRYRPLRSVFITPDKEIIVHPVMLDRILNDLKERDCND